MGWWDDGDDYEYYSGEDEALEADGDSDDEACTCGDEECPVCADPVGAGEMDLW